MQYQVRDGIVKINVCGIRFLTPKRSASDFCSPVMPLNVFSDIIWHMLSNEKSIDEIYSVFEQMFIMSNNKGSNTCKSIVDKSIKEFIDRGYVIKTGE